jgi:GT2 family glycosyltransferase
MKEPRSLLWICVNYNTYVETLNLIQGMLEAHRPVKNDLKIDIIVADNSMPSKLINPAEIEESGILFRQVITNSNVGYFGAVNFAISQEKLIPANYEFTVISNVDIQVGSDFFENLLKGQTPDNTGMIAPSILSKLEHMDKNPGIVSRPSKNKMAFYQFLYSNSWFYRLFLKIRKFRMKISMPDTGREPKIIYAAHGSVIIFCKAYFALDGNLKYPVFLFGEEIFLAEEMRKRNLLTIYLPSIRVFDDEHINTSKLKIEAQCKMSYEAIVYLKNKYFDDSVRG